MDHNGDFGTGARMIAVAVVSAVISATLVIAIGQPLLDRQAVASRPDPALLIRTSG